MNRRLDTFIRQIGCLPLFVLAAFLAEAARGQPYVAGDLIPDHDFELRNQNETTNLKAHEGQVVILAFFAEWCRSCRGAVEAVQQELVIRDHVSENDIQISYIPINLDSDNPERIDQFLMDNDLDKAADDFNLSLWDFYAESNSIPLLVIINGVSQSQSHRQWQMVHKQIGLGDRDAFFEHIDSVLPTNANLTRVNPFTDLESDGFGWKEIGWFGRFNDRHFPWIFHEQHQWLYIDRQTEGTHQITAYDSNLGWLQFVSSDPDQVFAHSRNVWLQHDPETTGMRQFFDHTAQEWFPFPTEREAQPGGRNGFAYTNAQIPVDEIRSGGPPRDGIPAILEPQFNTQETAASYMEDDDVVISVSHDGETRAYPFRILNWHEVVNDQIGDLHFAATYCPLCGTAIVFDRNVNDRILTFGVSGLLYLDNVLMYDHQTESLWSQLFLQSVTGSQFGTPLQFVPSEQMLYRTWKERYPTGIVLSTETGHNRNYDIDPYAGYFLDPNPLFPVGDIRNDLQPKAWVFGILVEGQPLAFARDSLPSDEAFQTTIGESTIDVLYDESSQNIRVTDPNTGEQVQGLWSFWFAWQAFHPNTDLWTGPTE